MLKWLKEARAEIVGGLVVALIVGLFSMLPFGGAKHEAEHVQEDSWSVIELRKQLEELRAEIHRKNEDLRQSDTRQQENSQSITDLQSQIEALQQELRRKDEALRQAEAQKQEASRSVTGLQQEKAKNKRPAMSDSDFLKLCKSGDVAKIEQAIIDGANVNAKDNYGQTALMSAAWGGQTETAKLLINHGADINAKANEGMTALMWAEFFGHTETANLLRSYGAR